jgi:hypothetical protein
MDNGSFTRYFKLKILPRVLQLRPEAFSRQ